jgi:hypothetical protein
MELGGCNHYTACEALAMSGTGLFRAVCELVVGKRTRWLEASQGG